MPHTIAIFWQFLLLGLTSFGGPAAHLGYFQRRFVTEKKWLTQAQFANMVALSQILPGPGSSQVGFAIGLKKGGAFGALAAFIGFTLPSFVLMLGLFYVAAHLPEQLAGAIFGLKLLAVMVVLDAVLNMAKSFCQTLTLKVIALFGAVTLALIPSFTLQVGLLLGVAAIAPFLPLPTHNNDEPTRKPWQAIQKAPLFVFVLCALFAVLGAWLSASALLGLYSAFFNAGALVFGGGHVVLPLLQQSLPELSQETVLTGYAAAQAIPGPMFTLATYLGAAIASNPIVGASIATVAVFLPGLLLMWAGIDAFQVLAGHPKMGKSIAAINAVVVGLLAAALINPIAISAIKGWQEAAVVAIGFGLLRYAKLPVGYVIILAVAAGHVMTFYLGR